MIKFKIIIFLFLIAFVLFPGQVESAFQYAEFGARPMGMNGAYSAITDDANSIVYNVAALGKLSRSELSTIYAVLNPGINDSLSAGGVAYIQPLPSKIGTLGIGDIEFSSILYSERTIYLSYAREMIKNMCLGVSFKYLGKNYANNAYTRGDRTFDFGKKMDTAGIGIDTGILLTNFVIPGLSLAAVGRNVNQPDIRLLKRDIVPAEYRVGIGYKTKEMVSIDIEGLWKTNSNNDQRILLGSEIWLLNSTAGLRAGIGLGNNEYYNISLGFSWKFAVTKTANSIVDYSFSYNPTGTMGTGNHHISLAFKF